MRQFFNDDKMIHMMYGEDYALQEPKFKRGPPEIGKGKNFYMIKFLLEETKQDVIAEQKLDDFKYSYLLDH